MSHYTVTIILPDKPKNPAHADEMISELVAPFDENVEVEPYKSHVDQVRSDWRTADPAKLGWPWSYVRRESQVDLDDLAAVADWMSSEDEPYYVDEKGLYTMSTYNPQSKWDWWVVGGRWSGFYPIEGGMADIVRKGDVRLTEESNIQTYAVLAEGVWRAPGSMGWFGMSTEDDAERADYSKWFNMFWQGLNDDAYLAVVDMHI